MPKPETVPECFKTSWCWLPHLAIDDVPCVGVVSRQTPKMSDEAHYLVFAFRRLIGI